MKKDEIIICSKQDLVEVIKDHLVKLIPLKSNDKKSDCKVEKNLIPRLDLAKLLKVSTVTIDKWVKNGVIPSPVKVGGRIYFDKDEVWNRINDKQTVRYE